MDERTDASGPAPEADPGSGGGPVPCELARELVSADADGELSGRERQILHGHLEACHECRAHAERVAWLTRRVRLRPAEPVAELHGLDGLSERVLARARPPRTGWRGWLRPALAWVAVVLAVQSIGPLLFGDADGASTHVARHVGAFSAALAVGLLYAAWRPHRAVGLLPFAVALVVTMSAAAVLDVGNGSSTPAEESLHLTELVGLALLWRISGARVPRRRRLPRLAGVAGPTTR